MRRVRGTKSRNEQREYVKSVKRSGFSDTAAREELDSTSAIYDKDDSFESRDSPEKTTATYAEEKRRPVSLRAKVTKTLFVAAALVPILGTIFTGAFYIYKFVNSVSLYVHKLDSSIEIHTVKIKETNENIKVFERRTEEKHDGHQKTLNEHSLQINSVNHLATHNKENIDKLGEEIKEMRSMKPLVIPKE